MFAEVKDSLPVSGDDYDGQIILQIKAAVLDLTSSTEIRLDGVVDISREPVFGVDATSGDEEITGWEIVDNSTIDDELVITAISVWCNMHIGNPPNYDNLLASYKSLKGQMRMSSRYNGGGRQCE